jgi:hypothetical protein
VSSSEYKVSDDGVWWLIIGNDEQEMNCGIIWAVTSACSWRDWGKPERRAMLLYPGRDSNPGTSGSLPSRSECSMWGSHIDVSSNMHKTMLYALQVNRCFEWRHCLHLQGLEIKSSKQPARRTQSMWRQRVSLPDSTAFIPGDRTLRGCSAGCIALMSLHVHFNMFEHMHIYILIIKGKK